MIKKIFIMIGALVMMLSVAACVNNNNPENENISPRNQTNEQQNKNSSSSTVSADPEEMKQQMGKLDFREFELEVSYGKNKEYEAEIDLDNGVYTSELEDELNGVHLKGKVAFDTIYPIVEMLTIDKTTNKTEVIKQILAAFELNDDYDKFEVEITFNDNSKIEFEDKK